MKNFKGKAIYNPSGKAGEYSYWACNFYNGCSAKCTYCYNRHGIAAKILGADKPTLKKSLGIEGLALEIFKKEADQNINSLREHGLFFNFVSDPFLRETYELNMLSMQYCWINEIPVKALTKQTWWLESFLEDFEAWINENLHRHDCKYLMAFGFTLTGHDEQESGAAPNVDRIRAMKMLNDEGFKTFASIEPIIDFESSFEMIEKVCNHVDLIKIGLQSGKKYDTQDIIEFTEKVDYLADVFGFKVYLKDSLVKAINTERDLLPKAFCVNRDYNLFKD